MNAAAVALLAALAALACPADATAQDRRPPARRAVPAQRPPPPERRPIGIDADLWFLAQLPNTATAFSAIGQDYPDLFSAGLGGGGSIAMAITVMEPTGGIECSLGPVLSFDSVVFRGRRARDQTGATFEPDDMSAATVLAGLQFRFVLGPHDAPVRFLGGFDLAAGVAFWPDTGATLQLPGPPNLTASGDLYEATTGFAWRTTLRAGIAWRLSPSFELTATAFAGIGRLPAPRDVNDPSNPFVPADPAPMTPWLAGFAVGVRWRAG